jgi:hypothetical protein
LANDIQETVTNFIHGDKEFHLFSSESKWIRKIHEYVEKYPNDVHIEYENEDGSLAATFPAKWFKISPPRHVSEEQKEKASERFHKMWADKKDKH